jgi:hypothetical protein
MEERDGHQMVLVHGDCYTGADKIAANYAKSRGWLIRPYPAQWRTPTGKMDRGAGPKRNRFMVHDSRPHVALAFRENQSSGTSHCISEIEKYHKGPTSRLETVVKIFEK